MFIPDLNANGAVAIAPIKHRQNAIANAGAAVIVIKGPEVDMANIATARITKSNEFLLNVFVNFI